MHKVALLVLLAAFAPQAAAARGAGIKAIGAIPEAYWGKWASGVEPCKSGDTEIIVLSAKAYTGPLGKCDVASVSETASPKGPTYSARLQCTDSSQIQKKTSANLIIRPGDANRISVGSAFESLWVYQRCSGKTRASK